MTDDVTVAHATPDDAEAMHRVWTAVAAEGRWIGSELPLHPQWIERFRAQALGPDSVWFVARADGEVVGGIFVHHRIGIADVGMAILDGHRGQGIGRRLLDRGVGWARTEGCHKVTLELWPHNDAAHALYLAAGFVDEGLRHRHYRRKSGELCDALEMGMVLEDD